MERPPARFKENNDAVIVTKDTELYEGAEVTIVGATDWSDDDGCWEYHVEDKETGVSAIVFETDLE